MTESAKLTVPATVAAMIDQAVELLIKAAKPDQIILFGSYGRGDFNWHSDLDLLVVLSTVDKPIEEMVRLRLVLSDLPMAIDLIVMSWADLEQRRHLRGTMLYHALREGKILYDAA